MAARLDGLRSFYEGVVWREHRTQANRTMLDSDKVLMLRPVECATADDTIAGGCQQRTRSSDSWSLTWPIRRRLPISTVLERRQRP